MRANCPTAVQGEKSVYKYVKSNVSSRAMSCAGHRVVSRTVMSGRNRNLLLQFLHISHLHPLLSLHSDEQGVPR